MFNVLYSNILLFWRHELACTISYYLQQKTGSPLTPSPTTTTTTTTATTTSVSFTLPTFSCADAGSTGNGAAAANSRRECRGVRWGVRGPAPAAHRPRRAGGLYIFVGICRPALWGLEVRHLWRQLTIACHSHSDPRARQAILATG